MNAANNEADFIDTCGNKVSHVNVGKHIGVAGTFSNLQQMPQHYSFIVAVADFGAKILLVPEEQEFDHDSIKVVGISNVDDLMRYLTS